MTNTQQTSYTLISAILFCAAMYVAFVVFPAKLEKEKHEPLEASPKDDIGVCVFTVDFGDRPILLWSNRRAKQASDGTITISATSSEDF